MHTRDLYLAWRSEADRLIARCIIGHPCHWPEQSSDPLELLDVRAANRALADGMLVSTAAETLAARKLARSYGREAVRAATRYRLKPIDAPARRIHMKERTLQAVTAWAV